MSLKYYCVRVAQSYYTYPRRTPGLLRSEVIETCGRVHQAWEIAERHCRKMTLINGQSWEPQPDYKMLALSGVTQIKSSDEPGALEDTLERKIQLALAYGYVLEVEPGSIWPWKFVGPKKRRTRKRRA